MSALNIQETKQLHEAIAALEEVAAQGYDPKGTDIKNKMIGRRLKAARDGVKAVWVMKGHYNS